MQGWPHTGQALSESLVTPGEAASSEINCLWIMVVWAAVVVVIMVVWAAAVVVEAGDVEVVVGGVVSISLRSVAMVVWAAVVVVEGGDVEVELGDVFSEVTGGLEDEGSHFWKRIPEK